MNADQPLSPPSARAVATVPPAWVLVCPYRRGTRLVLVVLGEADLSTAPELRHQLLAGLAFSPTAVTVDLAGLSFCGLAGLDALHDLLAAAYVLNVPVTLTGMSRHLSWLHRNFPPATAVAVAPSPQSIDLADAMAATRGLPIDLRGPVGAMLRVGRVAVGEDG